MFSLFASVNSTSASISRSWAVPPFDRVHTTSYSTLIETMCLSFAVFEIQPDICRK